MATILLLESDSILGKNTAAYLNLAGHQVTTHADLQAAILSVDITRPDVIVLDLMLAGRSGTEFLYELRSYPEWHDIPVLITGRYPSREINQYSDIFDQLNVMAYLPKFTTTLNDLLQRINGLQLQLV